MDKRFSTKVIFFNFFYSLIMICYHANAAVQFETVVSSGSMIDSILSCINQMFTGQSGTYFFMMLSAFMLYRDLTPDNAAEKVKRRVHTLLIPWILWNIIGLISYHPFGWSIQTVLLDFIMSRFCTQLWFVQALVLFLIFIPIFIKILRVKAFREIVVIFVFIFGYLLYTGDLSLQFLAAFTSEQFCREITRMLVHLPVYCLGAYLGLNHADFIMEETYNEKHRKIIFIGAVVLIIISYLPTAEFFRSICFMLRSAALWAICSKEMFTFEPKWWMQISFYTYAIHNFIIHFIGEFVRLSGIFGKQYASGTISIEFALLWRICVTGITFVLAMISAAILIKFVPRFYEMLSGGRVPRNVYLSRKA